MSIYLAREWEVRALLVLRSRLSFAKVEPKR